MAEESANRRLAAILAVDVVGYSRLMERDEAGTLAVLKSRRREVLEPLVVRFKGRVFKIAGDGALVEFASAVNAVECAIELQRQMAEANAGLLEDRRIQLRVGINLGDVMVEAGDLYGDGVNIAARLEGIAEPGRVFISGTVFDYVRNKLAAGFEDLGSQSLKNIAEPVRVYCVLPAGAAGAAPPTVTIPDKPSIAVLPFENMSDDPAQEYFADGMVEDIITALSRFRNLFVIARNSSFTYKGRTVDVKQVGRELGVRYALEGSVRRIGDRVRITAQLIEAATAVQLWSERYDCELANTFAVQDTITESVVGAIEPEVQQVERQRAARKSPENLDAWDHYMRGLWRSYQFNAEDNVQAELHMRRAIELDPTLALGHIGLVRVLAVRIWWGWSEDRQADGQTAYAAARRAVELDDRDPYAHYALSLPSLLMHQHEIALAEAQKAIDLAPNFALAYFSLGMIRLFAGRFDQVSDPIRRAMRLSPHDPLIFYLYYILALGQYHEGHYDDAATLARMGIGVRPFHTLYQALAACNGQLGRMVEARAALAEFHRLKPKDAEHLWDMINPYSNPTHREHFVDGMRKAGWTS
jgi:TolB-like protein/class 3 adenylate cyclase/Flp pilus assembly protein TadD